MADYDWSSCAIRKVAYEVKKRDSDSGDWRFSAETARDATDSEIEAIAQLLANWWLMDFAGSSHRHPEVDAPHNRPGQPREDLDNANHGP